MNNLSGNLHKVVNDVLLFGWYTGIWGICVLAALIFAKTM
jgi:hypothetical protein